MRIAMLGLKGLPATYGGVERYTEEVATRLAARGHDVTVYCRQHYTPAEFARQRHRGVQLVRLPSLNRRATDTLSHTFLSTMDVMRRRADVAVYHSLGNALFTPLPRVLGIPSLLILHCQEWREAQWAGTAEAFFRVSERASMTAASRVGVIARWLQDDLRARYGYETAFVSTGITLPEPRSSHLLSTMGLTPRHYVLFVGRLVPQKGIHLLLEAYRDLQTDMPLVIVGDAPHRQEYQQQLRSLNIPNVRFLGYRFGEELAALYSHAYLYTLPSEHEGIALTLLEAMAYNNAVLVSDIPANVEAAEPLGFTFQTGDANDLRRALGELLARPDLVDERRTRARTHVALRYNWDRVADHFEELCVELITPGKRYQVARRAP